MDKVKVYIKSILLPVITGAIIGLITSQSIDYGSLKQPVLAPPSAVFPIVWTILYVLMGVSFGILKSNSLNTKEVESIYYLQLIVNAAWSIFFFVFKWRLFSFIWIILLAVLVIIMIKRFYEQNKLSGLLQLPYLIWIIFAAYLNISIYLLNR